MPGFLQINANRNPQAMDLAVATATTCGAQYILVSEPNRRVIETRRWYKDKRGDAAIGYVGKKPGVTDYGAGHGFVWVKIAETYIYSGYMSPNAAITVFENSVNELYLDLLQKEPANVIVGGDFNSKSPMWGSTQEDRRGCILGEMFASLRMTALNEDGVLTFVRGSSGSTIDITMVNAGAGTRVRDWKVLLDEEPLSPHRYISFTLDDRRPERDTWKDGPINPRRLGEAMREELRTAPEKSPENLLNIMQTAHRNTTPKVRTTNGVIPYWWTAEISDLRREAVVNRRRLTRARAREAEDIEVELAANAYKQAKKSLRQCISRSKKRCWAKLLEEVDSDVFGEGYKIVTKTLRIVNPPLLLTKGELEKQVTKLFPRAERRDWNRDRAWEIPDFTDTELGEAAGRLKNNKAPGLDGIAAEVVKTAVSHIGEYMLGVLNEQLRNGSFPDAWKRARLVLVEKPRKEDQREKAYRPICLINTVAKLYEQLLNGRLRKALREGPGLSPHQHGFREGHSTIQAIEEVLKLAKEAHRRSPSEFCLLVLIDVRNAFNSARWESIIKALGKKRIPGYLTNVIKSYLTDRTVSYGSKGQIQTNVGVPQGSVLGPTLWNIMYDGIFDVEKPEGVTLVGYADDIAIVGTDKNIRNAVEKVNATISVVGEWLRMNGLELAPEKTEAIHIRFGRRRQEIEIDVGGTTIIPGDVVKYLGIMVDPVVSFGPHIRATAIKAEATVKALGRLMPNIGGPGEHSRRILASVAQSAMLYGAPVWAGAMGVATYRTILQGVQRKMALRIARAYRTASYEAVMVLSGLIPIHLMVAERSRIWSNPLPKGEASRAERNRTMEQWQMEWTVGTKGAWTRKLIPEVSPWVNRDHGHLTYHLTQALSGHGSFGTYLVRIGKAVDATCKYCREEEDTPEHTIFKCARWARRRHAANANIGVEMTIENIVPLMLRSRRWWEAISQFVNGVMSRKEQDERLDRNR